MARWSYWGNYCIIFLPREDVRRLSTREDVEPTEELRRKGRTTAGRQWRSNTTNVMALARAWRAF